MNSIFIKYVIKYVILCFLQVYIYIYSCEIIYQLKIELQYTSIIFYCKNYDYLSGHHVLTSTLWLFYLICFNMTENLHDNLKALHLNLIVLLIAWTCRGEQCLSCHADLACGGVWLTYNWSNWTTNTLGWNWIKAAAVV